VQPVGGPARQRREAEVEALAPRDLTSSLLQLAL
jgi:hypothetical protein